jgi:hypothetical protein
MYLWVYQISIGLAQLGEWDETAANAPATQPRRPLSFSDLKQGLRDYSTGATNDNTLRNGLLIMIAVVGVIALTLHYLQRRRKAGPKDSLTALAWELGRKVRFPFGSRLILWWVARAAGVPLASLLLSVGLFDRSVGDWAAQPTFGLLRKWGRGRLERLKPILFG